MKTSNYTLHLILLAEILVIVFFAGLLPDSWIHEVVSFFYFLLYLTCVLLASKWKKELLVIAISLTALRIITSIFGFSNLAILLNLGNFLFFMFIVILLIRGIARSENVDGTVILEAINGYLISGILFSALVSVILQFEPGSFQIDMENEAGILNVVYFTFVTLTTLGYGDMVPVAPYAKSLSLLIAVFGQIYLTVIIALLIGKYANSNRT